MSLGMYLNGSRSFGLRHMYWLAITCRYRVGEAHGGSRIDVVGVRKQLDGQGILCVEACC